MDPFDAFVLDSLLSEPLFVTAAAPRESLQPLDAQAALAAFLAEMDTFDHDLRPFSGSTGSDSGSNSSSANSADLSGYGGRSSSAYEAPVVPMPITTPAEPPVIRLETDCKKAITTAFSIFAQDRALAFAMEPPRPEKRKRRIRAKEEIDTLRDTAESLERSLKALKAGSTTARPTTTHRHQPIQSTAFSIMAAANDSTSKGVGVVALEMNRQLRQNVEAHLKLTTKIGDELLKHKQAKDTKEISTSWVTTETLGTQIPVTKADYAAFHEALTGKVDAIYAQLGDVFALNQAQVTAQDAQVILSGGNENKLATATLQFRDEKILPFDFQSVCDASWRCAQADSLSSDQGFNGTLVNDDDVLLIKKTLSAQMEDDREVHIPVRIVFKRFLSKHRMVFCWEGTAEWPCEFSAVTENGAARSVPMREKGWGLIQPLPGSSSGGSSGGEGGSDTRLCHVQICVRMTPGLSDERMVDAPSQVEQLAQLVIPTYQQMINARFQMIENLLLDKYL